MADLFSTNTMTSAIGSLLRPSSFLLDMFFPSVQLHMTEEIHFDVFNKTRRLAPFVSPVVAGKVVQEHGFSTKTFKPAYIKIKTPLSPQGALKRSAGEMIGGQITPAQRQQARLGMTLLDHMEQITRRLEWMAASAMRNGSVTVSGDEYQTSVVDFGRDGALSVTLAGAARWGQAGVKPLDSLQDWALEILKKSGAQANEVVMDVDAWKVFRDDADVKQRLDTRRVVANAMSMDALTQVGGIYMGTVDGFNIYVYAEWYVDDAGVEQPMLPSGTVLMGGAGIDGVREFGAIQDEEAGLQSMEIYPKSWVPKDPAVRQVLSQSAPLVVPSRVNASFSATVL